MMVEKLFLLWLYTTTLALNYNNSADVDDGSCIIYMDVWIQTQYTSIQLQLLTTVYL